MFPWFDGVGAWKITMSICGCIHAVTSEYGFKLAVGVIPYSCTDGR